jgi:hypothetical protein
MPFGRRPWQDACKTNKSEGEQGLGMIWFFRKRIAAIRIVERVCDDIKTPEATEVIEMIVWGIKHFPTRQIPVQERSIIIAIGLWKNPTAVERLIKAGHSEGGAVSFLRNLGRAALALAREEGFSEMLRVPAALERAEQLDMRWD